MDTSSGGRSGPPRVLDLGRGPVPTIEILACETYDFLLSAYVAVASPLRGYSTDYFVYETDPAWIESALARTSERDPRAIDTLGRLIGGGLSTSLNAGLLPLIYHCPAPRNVERFLSWLATLPASEVVEFLLEQEDAGSEWTQALAAALASPGDPDVRNRLVMRYPEQLWPVVTDIVTEPEGTRADLVAALRVWHEAVFAAEASRILPLLKRQAAALEQRLSDLPAERFIEEAMHNIHWHRRAGMRRIIFAPSYFCRPAVAIQYWRGVLTVCPPVDDALVAATIPADEPDGPSPEVLRVFETLGDATRLRILRLLAGKEMYLTELADALKLSKATTKHHMVKLRAAKLVDFHVPQGERLTYYSLRADIPQRTRQLLQRYLTPRG